MRMAVAAPTPSLREASCCRVEVMKGGGGLRRTWRRSIEATAKARRSISRLACSARSWLSRSNLSSLRPSRWVRRAFNVCFLAVPNSASTVQYSRRLEDLDLGLALADQAQRHRLHAAGRAAARQLAPQHRREGEAHQIVERAARQVGVDQRLVEVARMGDGVEHRLLGDGVEGDALDVDALQRLLARRACRARARRSPRPRDPGRWRDRACRPW